jgi:hypothetical protein
VGKRLSSSLGLGLVVAGFLVGSLVALSRTTGQETADREPAYRDPCPPDRDEMVFTYTTDGTTYERLDEVVELIAKDYGYRRLTASERQSVAVASSEATTLWAADQPIITFDPNLPDTDAVLNLVVQIEGTPDGRYIPRGGSFCARVSGK